MSRKLVAVLIILMMAILAVPGVLANQAPLPDAEWFAVVHVPETDTLHWVNDGGYHASTQRPTWTDENPNIAPKLHITPDGRTLIQVITAANGRQQIAFHDLETGQLLASHEAQSGESFIWSDDNPSALAANRFAIGMSAPDVSQWRIIVFDTATGAALHVLTQDAPGVPLPANTFFPYVLHYDLNEGQGQLSVHFQMRSAANEVHAFEWIPEQGEASVMMGAYNFNPESGYDVDLLSDSILFIENAQTVKGYYDGVMDELITESGTPTNPIWLNRTEWFAYYYQDGVFAPHWRIADVESSVQVIPFGPNITALYSTPDGLLAFDTFERTLMHSTALPVDAHQAQIGTTIFSSDYAFDVVYVTPWGANFNLPSVYYSGGVNNDLDVAAPVLCDEAPESRLAIGMRARVTYTDGVPLRVRNAPNGEIITQLQEGTEFNVIGGSVCENGYLWWQIQTDDNLIGWSAEGADDSYFIEPWQQVAPPTAEPTELVFVAPVNPTATTVVGGVYVAPQPTATAAIGVYVAPAICNNSPESRLSVGDHAHTDTTGTLAMRTNLSDQYPSNQIPDNVTVLILEGPRCSDDGQRMWRVRTRNVDGDQVEGWIAEGWQNTYYLIPGMARANS